MPERPTQGMGHYLRDVVYGASDGVVTTLAIVAGVAGADFAPAVAVVLGLANLIADGFSMGSANYLGLKSELQQTGASVAHEKPWRHGAVTMLAFVVAGAVPLAAYLVPVDFANARITMASILSLLALMGIGILRAPFTNATRLGSAAEMVVVGGLAGGAAFAVGMLVGPALT